MIVGRSKRHDVVLEFLDYGIPRNEVTAIAVSCEEVALLNMLLVEGQVTKRLPGLSVPIFTAFVGLSVPRKTDRELVNKFSVSWQCVRESILQVVDWISTNDRLYQLAKNFVDYRRENQKDKRIV